MALDESVRMGTLEELRSEINRLAGGETELDLGLRLVDNIVYLRPLTPFGNYLAGLIRAYAKIAGVQIYG